MTFLTHFDPFRDFGRLQSGLEALWNQDLKEARSTWVPAVDIVEQAESYSFIFDLPDLKKEDVKVTFNDGVLTVGGQRKAPSLDTQDIRVHRSERGYGAFERRFNVPDDAEISAINAEFKDGVLRVTLPKMENAKPKVFDVKIN